MGILYRRAERLTAKNAPGRAQTEEDVGSGRVNLGAEVAAAPRRRRQRLHRPQPRRDGLQVIEVQR